MFPVVTVPPAAGLVEQLGTKPKFWFDERRTLFKEGRADTGENWAEVIGAQLCELLGLPHATYSFATWTSGGDEVRRGVVTANFAPRGRLVLGNELLPRVTEYDGTLCYKQTAYSMPRVRAALRSLLPPSGFSESGLSTAIDVFVGYLMLDAWIANQDRHHENWGSVVESRTSIVLTPAFDHAAGFGSILTDRERAARLTTRDAIPSPAR